MARIPLTPAPEWPDEMNRAIGRLLPPEEFRSTREGTRRRPVVLEAFSNNPPLADAFFGFNRHVLWGTSLTPRWRHVLIIRVGARRRCAYLWGEHVGQARNAGLTDDEIERLAAEPRALLTDPLEVALAAAADEVIDAGSVSEPTWSVLGEHLDASQLLDVVFTIGCYNTVAAFMLTVDLEVDPAVELPWSW